MDAADGTSIVLGSTTVGLLIKEFFAWWRSRNQKTQIEPSPLAVKLEETFVSRNEFERHVKQNASEHEAMVEDRERNYEALYNRMTANDKLTSEINGKLSGIKEDLTLIKTKLFKTTVR